MEDKKFIITTDKDTANKLIDAGCHVVSVSGGTYTFLNNGRINFSQENMTYTNTLCF